MLLLLLFVKAETATGAVVRLAWDPSPDADVTGYRLYWGVQSGTYVGMHDVGGTTTTSAGWLADDTTYFFAVTAYNSSGLESDFSNEVEYTTPAAPLTSDGSVVTTTGEVAVLLGEGASGSPAPPDANHPPAVSDQTVSVAEDGAVDITLEATDPEGDAIATRLVEGPSFGVLAGEPPRVSYRPSPGFTGVDRFTYRANDGQEDSGLGTVSLTVTPVNHAPTISEIADQTTNPGLGVGPIGFTVNDEDQPPESLTILVESSNPAIVPAPNCCFGGDAGERTLTVMPVAGRSGTTMLTITVSDGWLNASTSFRLRVDADAPPGWSVADVGSVPVVPGSTVYADGVFTLTGSGADHWNTDEPFQFAYQTLIGNGEIIARVYGFGDPAGPAKAGLMIRDLGNRSKGYVLMCVTPAGFLFDASQSSLRKPVPPPGRFNTAGQGPANIVGFSRPTVGALNPAPDNWIGLRRIGNRFCAYVSHDGVRWQPWGPPLILNLPPTVAVGLATSSSNPTELHTATFDNVTVQP